MNNPAEREAMAAYLKKRNLRDYALFAVGVSASWNIPDLLALNVRDVASIGEDGKLNIAKMTKGAVLDKKLSGEARRALAAYLKQRGKAAPVALEEPLFKCDKPRQGPGDRWRMTKYQAGRVLAEAARACGLPCKAGGKSVLDYFTADLWQEVINEAVLSLRLFSTSKGRKKSKGKKRI